LWNVASLIPFAPQFLRRPTHLTILQHLDDLIWLYRLRLIVLLITANMDVNHCPSINPVQLESGLWRDKVMKRARFSEEQILSV